MQPLSLFFFNHHHDDHRFFPVFVCCCVLHILYGHSQQQHTKKIISYDWHYCEYGCVVVEAFLYDICTCFGVSFSVSLRQSLIPFVLSAAVAVASVLLLLLSLVSLFCIPFVMLLLFSFNHTYFGWLDSLAGSNIFPLYQIARVFYVRSFSLSLSLNVCAFMSASVYKSINSEFIHSPSYRERVLFLVLVAFGLVSSFFLPSRLHGSDIFG